MVNDACSACGGTGTQSFPCCVCGGSGQVFNGTEYVSCSCGGMPQNQSCGACGGSGWVQTLCTACPSKTSEVGSAEAMPPASDESQDEPRTLAEALGWQVR